MKKIVAMLLISTFVCLSGCKITPEQAKVIAQQAGVFSAVGWIAADNPPQGVVAAMAKVMVEIETNINAVASGKTYTEVVYPAVVKVIDAKVDPRYKPLAKAGALSFLGGLDLLFAMHPEWKADEDTALAIAKAYVQGVEQGLNLNPTDPVMIQARNTARLRYSMQPLMPKIQLELDAQQAQPVPQKQLPAKRIGRNRHTTK